jgi:hypothetical protein
MTTSAKAVLRRETFTTSRLLEFFSEKELQMQIGFSRDGWAIALLKELIDNALDACEQAGVALNLESEQVEYGDTDPRDNLRERGATEEEIEFLVRGKSGSTWVGERVEINAMTSDVMVEWLEKKLTDVGAVKVVPSDDTLAEAWKQALRRAKVQVAIDKALEEARRTDAPMPDGLANRIREAVKGKAESWDLALFDIALESLK